MQGGQSDKPSFLRPAFDVTPATPALQADRHDRQNLIVSSEPPSMPAAPADSRPPSASGERSRALSQGFVKISEVEATKRLNDSLEQENAQLEAEIAELLRRNKLI
ncbi:unnamed protein product [Effrenium voratum]|nr:unnamed protein product [Effrenium voratum]